MDMTVIVILLPFAAGVILLSYQVWFLPAEFLKNTRSFRESLYKKRAGFLFRHLYGSIFDPHPKLELWLVRLGLLIIYCMIVYLIFQYQNY